MNIQEIASASALIKQELTPLAEKIGQGAEWTFEIFVKQAYVSAFTDCLFIVPGIILFYFSHWFYKKEKADWKHSYNSGLGYTLGTVCLILGLVAVLVPLAGLIQVLVNPEYAAIKIIITTIKGSN